MKISLIVGFSDSKDSITEYKQLSDIWYGSKVTFFILAQWLTFVTYRAVNPHFLAGRHPVFEAVSLSPCFKRNLPVFENNQVLNIKVYENDMRKNSLPSDPHKGPKNLSPRRMPVFWAKQISLFSYLQG